MPGGSVANANLGAQPLLRGAVQATRPPGLFEPTCSYPHMHAAWLRPHPDTGRRVCHICHPPSPNVVDRGLCRPAA